MGAAGERDIRTRVNQNAAAMRIRQRQCAPDEIVKLARREVLFADLDALDPVMERSFDIPKQGRRPTGRVAVGNVLPQHQMGS
jgi:hypothetical protein